MDGILVAFWVDGVLDGTMVGTTELTPLWLAMMVADWLGFKFTEVEPITDDCIDILVGGCVEEGFNGFVYVDKLNPVEFFG